VAKADLCFIIPESWSWEDAAQISLSFLTACQMLYQSLSFRLLPERATPEPTPIVVYGASSTCGHYAIQLAKLGGLKVYATCSPRNFDLVRGLGADEVYDYKDSEAPKKLKDSTGGKLKYAADAISQLGSDTFISSALSDDGGKIAILLSHGEDDRPREGVELVYSLTFDFFVDVSISQTELTGIWR
jgi:NADPH:quinone reductase-like Zn-dependent oxidoreductase